MKRVRNQLGQLTALGLELLVVSDVLETLLKSTEEFTFEAIGKIGLIAVVRTFLAYFLSLEVKEIEEAIEHDSEKEEKTDKKMREKKCE